MAEVKKQRMDPERFIEIFRRYAFEEKGELLERLKGVYRADGAEIRDKLLNDLNDIENKISL